ncbi:uncharacterized protein B0H18DRAFT_999313 [Fomitopsis serialis]|uniref:uncharacterized protein n=1 Tax=Fomitopsis serialis TaxID=139415 RepID=UPI002008C151|nr:uncharacterized protein B0H18DRAFT_999313 [Neoantrodia serialis]KAH9928907.1 hypothetical protein B0H18DRAFT_999313 [Neoantrodia serialis]
MCFIKHAVQIVYWKQCQWMSWTPFLDDDYCTSCRARKSVLPSLIIADIGSERSRTRKQQSRIKTAPVRKTLSTRAPTTINTPTQRPQHTSWSMLYLDAMTSTGSGVEMGFPQASHRLNVAPPFYFCTLPKSGLKLVFCDKPRSSDGYTNVIRVMEDFVHHQLRQKKAKKFNISALILSEIAHVSEEPLEPTHMLVRVVLAGETSIPRGLAGHVYLVGWVPKAHYDTATVDWKALDDLAEHEIWAMREAQVLRMDTIGEVISAT